MLCTYICTYMHVCMTPIPLTHSILTILTIDPHATNEKALKERGIQRLFLAHAPPPGAMPESNPPIAHPGP